MLTETDRRVALKIFGAVAATAGLTLRASAVNAGGIVTSGNSVPTNSVHYKTVKIGDVEVFYREAGPADAPVILLLHGYPTSSHMFRDLIPQLAGPFRLIAPDLPGFGLTKAPDREHYTYTFDNLAKTIDGFTDALGLKRYALYLFDYGAPTGFRIAAAHPERVSALITQNGNAYEEGLGDAWKPIRAYWKDASLENRNALRAVLTLDATKDQYLHGADAGLVSPDGYMLDYAYLQRPGIDEIQLDLFYDYRNNVALYPAWQKYLRQNKPPLLAVWGKNDLFFIPPGAEAFKRDIPDAEIKFVDSGHFATATHSTFIAAQITDFMRRKAKL
jgi:pimeloyl-ACP methyl ester carboxylesterase